MARQTTHICAVVLAPVPIEMAPVHRMTGEAGLIQISSGNLQGVDGAFRRLGPGTVFGMLIAVAVTSLTG